MHLLPYIVSRLKVRPLNESSHENLPMRIFKKKGYILSLEHSINKNVLLSESTVGLSDKAP